jgi:hypothetical protein
VYHLLNINQYKYNQLKGLNKKAGCKSWCRKKADADLKSASAFFSTL